MDESVNIDGLVGSIVAIGLMTYGIYLLGVVGIGFVIYLVGMSFAEAGIRLGMKIGETDESSTSW